MDALEIEGRRGMIFERLSRGMVQLVEDNLEKGVNFPYLEKIPRLDYVINRYYSILGNSFKIYLPLHLFLLAMRLAKKGKNRKNTLWRALVEYLRSCAFASLSAIASPIGYAYFSKLQPNARSKYWGIAWASIFSIPIFAESRNKWSEISLYYFYSWLEAAAKSLQKRECLPRVPYWDKLILMIAVGLVTWVHLSPTFDHLGETRLDGFVRYIIGDCKFDRPTRFAKAQEKKLKKQKNKTAPETNQQ